jgi:formylglycine-generating enzyme required for sulfatase activity
MTPDPFAPNPRSSDVRMTNIFDRLRDDAPQQAKVVDTSVGIRLVLIRPGSFEMGAFENEPGSRANEYPRHPVVVSDGFYLGMHPVTQAQYRLVTGTNPSHFDPAAGGGPDHPVERVSWEDAVAFCRLLSARPEERAAGRAYRLPTEAEWEYACRAGETAAFTFGRKLSPAQANVGGAYRPDGTPAPPAVGRTTPVGAYPANNYGLFDVHGNVWEWVDDWYDEAAYATATLRDPKGPAAGEFKVVRGGCWRSQPASCRAAYRNALVPNNRDPYTGFRVAAAIG